METSDESARIYAAVPQFSRLREEVLLGDVWEQPELAARDRSLVTCSVLATLGKLTELQAHLKRGRANGLTKDDIRGMVVQVAFYAGWPAGLLVGRAALGILEGDD